MKKFAQYIKEDTDNILENDRYSKDFTKPKRVWINCPSTNQPYHSYHGKVGIAHTNDKGETHIYFTEGNTSSFEIDPLYCETKNSHVNAFKYDH